jgi:hypothetical protein
MALAEGLPSIVVGAVGCGISLIILIVYFIWLYPSLDSRALQIRRPKAYLLGHVFLFMHVLSIGVPLTLGSSASCSVANALAAGSFAGYLASFWSRIVTLYLQVALRTAAGMTLSLDDKIKSPSLAGRVSSSGPSDPTKKGRWLLKNREKLVQMQLTAYFLYLVLRWIGPIVYIAVNDSQTAGLGIDSDTCRQQWMIVDFIGLGFFILIDLPLLLKYVYFEKESFKQLVDNYYVKEEMRWTALLLLAVMFFGQLFGFIWYGVINSMVLFFVFVGFVPFVLHMFISYRVLRKSWGGMKSEGAAKLSKINAVESGGVDERDLCLSLLRDPQVFPRFEEFLKKEHANENILFWKEVEDMREVSKDNAGTSVAAKMVGIYKLYMEESSPLCVNISSELQKELKSKINTLYDSAGNVQEMSRLFDDAQYEIVTLLTTNFLNRFKAVLNNELGSRKGSKSNGFD